MVGRVEDLEFDTEEKEENGKEGGEREKRRVNRRALVWKLAALEVGVG